MKKLILFLLFSTPLIMGFPIDTTGTTITPADASPVMSGNNAIYVDSLWNGVYVLTVDSQFTTTDTTVILDTMSAHASATIPLNYDYDWATLTVIDTGTTYTDSCSVNFLAYDYTKTVTRRSPEYTKNNSFASQVNFMRDSTWANTNLVPDNNSVHSYTLFVGGLDALYISMDNAVTVDNRIWKYILQLTRKK